MPPPRSGRSARPPGRGHASRRGLVPYVFLAPFLIGFAIFVIGPLVYVLNLSLYRTKIVGGRTFVGLDNYVKVLSDESFWTGVGNVLTFGLIQIPIMLGIALVAALLLDSTILRRRVDLPAGVLPAVRRVDASSPR